MKKHINALLGFVCYTIGVIAAAYYGLWKMLVLPLHTLAVSFLAGDLNVTLLAVCVVKILFSTTMAGLIWCILKAHRIRTGKLWRKSTWQKKKRKRGRHRDFTGSGIL